MPAVVTVQSKQQANVILTVKQRRALETAQEAVASALARDGIKVIFDSPIPCIDLKSKTMHLPALPEEMRSDDEVVLRGWLDHEVAHVLFSDVEWPKRATRTKTIKIICNLVEDTRVDKMMFKRYYGSRHNIEESTRHAHDEAKPDNFIQAGMLLVSDVGMGADFDENLDMWCGRLANPLMIPVFRKMAENARTETIQAYSVGSTNEAIDCGIAILDKWKEVLKDLPKGGGSGEGDDEDESDEEGDGEGNGSSDDKDSDKDKKGKKGKGKGKKNKGKGKKNKKSKGKNKGDDSQDSDEGDDSDSSDSDSDGDENSNEDGESNNEDGEGDNEGDENEDGEGTGEGEGDEDGSGEEDGDEDESDGEGSSDGDDEDESDGKGKEGSDKSDTMYDSTDDGDDDGEGASEGEGEDGEGDGEGDEDDDDVDGNKKRKCDGTNENWGGSSGAGGGYNGGGRWDGKSGRPNKNKKKNKKKKKQRSDSEVEKEMDENVENFKTLKEEVAGRVEDMAKRAQNASGAYVAFTDNDHIEKVDFEKHVGFDAAQLHREASALRDEAKRKVSVVSQKIKMDLLTQTKVWARDQERGKIDDRRLHKVPMGSKRVFKRKCPRQGIDVAFALLFDCSGSMTGWNGRSEKVGQLGYVMGETLDVVGAPFEMVGFTTYHHYEDYGGGVPVPRGMHYTRTTPLRLVVYKTFDEKRVRDMDKRMVCVSKFSEGALTIEGEPLMWLARRLASRPEQRKILIVMCDGAPQASGWEESNAVRTHLPNAIKRVRTVGIELISVGIQTDAPRAFYGDDCFVQYDNLDMLLTHFYPRLGKILRGERRSVL